MPQNHHFSGYVYAVIAVTLWAGWGVVTRLGVTTNLPPMDMIFTRFLVAGLIMLPIAINNRHLITKKNRKTALIMLVCSGPLYMLFMAYGLKYGPAVHGIITPASLPLLVAVISFFLFKEKFPKARMLGYGFIMAGIAFKILTSLAEVDYINLLADFLFIGGAICWATYTILNKKLGFDAIVTTSFVTVGSMIIIAPFFTAYKIISVQEVDYLGAWFQIFYQAIMTSIISLVLYNKAVKQIGVAKASAFGALVPAIVVGLSKPILNEAPTTNDLILAAIMTAGVLLASGILNLKRN